MCIDFASRLSYFSVKCVIIGHCFRHTSANRDRKRLRITDHSLGNDASYNPGNRKLHRRFVRASSQSHSHSRHPALEINPLGLSLPAHATNPSIVKVPYRITKADVCKNSKQWMTFGPDAIFCPLAPVSYHLLQFHQWRWPEYPLRIDPVQYLHIKLSTSHLSILPGYILTQTDTSIFLWNNGIHNRQHITINGKDTISTGTAIQTSRSVSKVRITVVWGAKPCRTDKYRRFERIYCLHFQGTWIRLFWRAM